MNKQINLVINGKGGVGKSFFATNFVQYLKDCGIEHRAIDSDHENSTLKRFHPEAEFINLEHRREIDRVFTAAETSDLLVIDCRAASTDLFIDFFDEVGLSDVLRSFDARLTVVCPVNHEADSVEQLRTLSEALYDRCGWVVVKNEAHSESFKIYDGSKTRRQIVDALHAREITMPRLYDWLVTALNEHNATATAALQNPAFNLLDRQRLKNWQTRFYRQIYRAADLLLVDAHVAEKFAA
jgi:CobQ/CobB/MinD/ParA nucleotide binding domain